MMAFKTKLPLAAILAGSVLVSGCAGSSDRFPSLAPRDAERVSGTIGVMEGDDTEQVTPAPIPIDAGLTVRLAALVQQATDAHSRFQSDLAPAERLIANAKGSNNNDNVWAAAQIALANLDSHRSQTAIAMGDLDLLYADASVVFARRAEIGEAQAQAAGLLAQEDRELSRLRQLMPE